MVLNYIWLLILTLSLSAQVSPRMPEARHGLRFDTPATTWDEAMPLGNGMMGALLWGDGKPVRISIDRADLWDLRKVPEFESEEYSFALMRRWHEQNRLADLKRVYEDPYNRPAPSKIPAGRIEVDLGAEAQFKETALDVRRAAASMQFAGGARIEVFVHATQPLGLIRVAGTVKPLLRLAPPPYSGTVRNAAAGGISPGDLAQLGYPPTKTDSGADWAAWSQEGAEGFRFAVYAQWRRRAKGWEAAWSIASSREGGNPEVKARTRAQQALVRGFDAMRASHELWWAGYWAKSSVTLPDPLLERMWYLEQYKFGAASRRGAPPITLQAVWTADNGQLPPWKGDYHHDLNTQLCYWPAYSGNHLEEQLAYLDWLWATQDTGFAWTRRFFGLPGLNVPMTADLNGNQIGGWRQYTHSATTSAWLAHHFWLHWRYSNDRKFLLERGYPYVKQAATFLEAFTAQKGFDGFRTHPMSASPEIHDNKPQAWFPSVTNYDLALDRWVMGAAAKMAHAAGLSGEAEYWQRVESEFPDLARGEQGNLLVAAGIPLPYSHRHFSHLMAIHPLGLVDWEDGEAAKQTIRASLADLDAKGTSQWTGYSFAWLASLAARARDGERAARALQTFATAFCLRNSFHANGDQSGKGYSTLTYRPFTLEGNFAAAAGLQEMLLQSHRGVIRVFPAVPSSWRDVSFTTLRAEGAFLVSASKKEGQVQRVEVRAENGGTCRVALPWDGTVRALTLRAGELKVLVR